MIPYQVTTERGRRTYIQKKIPVQKKFEYSEALAKAFKKAGPETRRKIADLLICIHEGTAVSVMGDSVQRWGMSWFEREDLLSSIRAGVIRALRTYNPEKGSFYTHYSWWAVSAKTRYYYFDLGFMPKRHCANPPVSLPLDAPLPSGRGTRIELLRAQEEIPDIDFGKLKAALEKALPSKKIAGMFLAKAVGTQRTSEIEDGLGTGRNSLRHYLKKYGRIVRKTIEEGAGAGFPG